MRHSIVVVALLLGLGLTPPTLADTDDLRELAALLVGDYFSAATGGVREGRPIYLRIRSIEAPSDAHAALYAEMRHDGVDGEIYRQRVYLFERQQTAPLRMQALVFEDQQPAVGLIADPALWVRLGWKTQLALVEGCDTYWVRAPGGFVGKVDPKTCLIIGKRGDQRRIASTTLITREFIGQSESGYDIDGARLFGNADDELYIWPRVQ